MSEPSTVWQLNVSHNQESEYVSRWHEIWTIFHSSIFGALVSPWISPGIRTTSPRPLDLHLCSNYPQSNQPNNFRFRKIPSDPSRDPTLAPHAFGWFQPSKGFEKLNGVFTWQIFLEGFELEHHWPLVRSDTQNDIGFVFFQKKT